MDRALGIFVAFCSSFEALRNAVERFIQLCPVRLACDIFPRRPTPPFHSIDMRTIIVFILLAVAGHYLYTWKGSSTAQQSVDDLPAEIAWRAVTRDRRGAVTLVEVAAVNGNRWRVEIKTPAKPATLVAVSDGSAAAASIANASTPALDPRPVMRSLLTRLRNSSPEATEQISGRPYLRFAETVDGNSVHVWADPKTRFPYRIRGLTQFTDVTYTPLPAASVRGTPNLFSVHALKPLLSHYATTQ